MTTLRIEIPPDMNLAALSQFFRGQGLQLIRSGESEFRAIEPPPECELSPGECRDEHPETYEGEMCRRAGVPMRGEI